MRVEGLRLAGPEAWLVRAGKALLQAVPIAQVPASSLQALGTPGARSFLTSCVSGDVSLISMERAELRVAPGVIGIAECRVSCLYRKPSFPPSEALRM